MRKYRTFFQSAKVEGTIRKTRIKDLVKTLHSTEICVAA